VALAGLALVVAVGVAGAVWLNGGLRGTGAVSQILGIAAAPVRGADAGEGTGASGTAPARGTDTGSGRETGTRHVRAALPGTLPGLGPRTLAEVPADTRQALVVTGVGRDASQGSAILYERTPEGWRAGSYWPAQNAQRGWTDHHMQGDLRSPIGVFGLTDAGGLLANPGTKLPYDKGSGYHIDRTDNFGQSLAGSFDYVVAVNYNRIPGRNPLDWGRPLGMERGGGIWIHVEHTTPTSGCIALKREAMRTLLRTLDPAKKPVVVMGPKEELAK
jgi:L,D-peptidoglycan transpeptidase YkuD (ErfK/YbiS/YcfS/YnhG family)